MALLPAPPHPCPLPHRRGGEGNIFWSAPSRPHRTPRLAGDCYSVPSPSRRVVINQRFPLLNSPHGRSVLTEEHAFRLLGNDGVGVDGLCARVSADHRLARADRVEPTRQIGEIVDLLALAFVRHHPRVTSDVGDRIIPHDKFAI